MSALLIRCESICPLVRGSGSESVQCKLHLTHPTPHMATLSQEWSDKEQKHWGQEMVILTWLSYETSERKGEEQWEK